MAAIVQITRESGAFLIAILFAIAAGVAQANDDPPVEGVQPSPSLAPEQVVRIQLEALRRNSAGDGGIAVAFRFASPGNRRNTGPLTRFARMIKDGPYALMLRYVDASFAPVRIDGDEAAQEVTLIGPDEAITYVFFLSRQKDEGPLKDCWMTDGVAMAPTPGRPT